MCYSNLLWIMIKISNNDLQFVWRMEHNSYIPDYRDKPLENLHSEDLPKRPFTTLSRSNSLHQSSMHMIIGMTSTYLLFVYATILNIVSVSSESKEETMYKVVLLSYSIIYPEKWLELRALQSGTVAHHKFWYSLQSYLYFSSLKWIRKKLLTRRDYYELRSFCKYLAPARAITVLTASTKI